MGTMGEALSTCISEEQPLERDAEKKSCSVEVIDQTLTDCWICNVEQ